MWEISPADLHLDVCIGSGGFGQVWRGRWNNVKKLQDALLAMDLSMAEEFQREIEFIGLCGTATWCCSSAAGGGLTEYRFL